MGQIALTNVVDISVNSLPTPAQEYNTSNLALFTNDAPGASFGSAGYAIYVTSTTPATDFGTAAMTTGLADAAFSQQPNILANDGYLTVIPFLPSTQTLAFSGTPATGSFTLVLNGSQSVVVTATESASAIQSAIQALPGLSQVTVAGAPASGPVTLTFYGVHTQAAISTSGNTLETAGASAVTITPAVTQSSETLSAAITRTQGLVQYFGIIVDQLIDTMGSVEVLAAASTVQALNKMLVVVTNQSTQLGSTGIAAAVASAALTQTRVLYYGNTSDGGSSALAMAAAYASRGFSVDFSGNLTTITMALKELIGIAPDPSMTQTIFQNAKTAGADCYVSFAGSNGVQCNGANDFFDNVYNLQWLVGALEIAGFNFLQQTGTKVAQTEPGMAGLKGAYRKVLEEANTPQGNGYLAPGTWTSSVTFGNQADFLANIEAHGYYIYSQPVSQQAATDRAARKAPLIQIAIKLAGAIQTSNVVVNVNA